MFAVLQQHSHQIDFSMYHLLKKLSRLRVKAEPVCIDEKPEYDFFARNTATLVGFLEGVTDSWFGENVPG